MKKEPSSSAQRPLLFLLFSFPVRQCQAAGNLMAPASVSRCPPSVCALLKMECCPFSLPLAVSECHDVYAQNGSWQFISMTSSGMKPRPRKSICLSLSLSVVTSECMVHAHFQYNCHSFRRVTSHWESIALLFQMDSTLQHDRVVRKWDSVPP